MPKRAPPHGALATCPPFSVTKDFKNASNRESRCRPLFKAMRRLAAKNRLHGETVATGPRFSQIVLETVQSNPRPESSFEKRKPHELTASANARVSTRDPKLDLQLDA
jgi:hypothetical protein